MCPKQNSIGYIREIAILKKMGKLDEAIDRLVEMIEKEYPADDELVNSYVGQNLLYLTLRREGAGRISDQLDQEGGGSLRVHPRFTERQLYQYAYACLQNAAREAGSQRQLDELSFQVMCCTMYLNEGDDSFMGMTTLEDEKETIYLIKGRRATQSYFIKVSSLSKNLKNLNWEVERTEKKCRIVCESLFDEGLYKFDKSALLHKLKADFYLKKSDPKAQYFEERTRLLDEKVASGDLDELIKVKVLEFLGKLNARNDEMHFADFRSNKYDDFYLKKPCLKWMENIVTHKLKCSGDSWRQMFGRRESMMMLREYVDRKKICVLYFYIEDGELRVSTGLRRTYAHILYFAKMNAEFLDLKSRTGDENTSFGEVKGCSVKQLKAIL
jgi:hypothetical protein